MRVALFTDTYLPEVNGAAQTLGRWVAFLKSQGIPCKVFAPTAEDRLSVEQSTVERFFSIPFLLYPERKFAIPNPIHMKKTLLEFSPTLIHAATPFNIGMYGNHYARKYNIPLVASYHTHFDQYLSYYKLQWMEPLLMKYLSWFHSHCRKVYVPSKSAMEHLRQYGFTNMEIWSRGIDAGAFHPDVDRNQVLSSFGVNPRRLAVLFVGRLALEKSLDVLLAAFRALPEQTKSQAELVIVGDGPLYKELAGAIGPDEPIHLLGFVKGRRLRELYAASDIFLFPSATETFGNVVLEAFASGTPVIGADAGGVRDIVRHNVTGLLCPPGNVSAFSRALHKMLVDVELREKLGIAAREYAVTKSWDRIFQQMLASYRSVLDHAAKSADPSDKALIV